MKQIELHLQELDDNKVSLLFVNADPSKEDFYGDLDYRQATPDEAAWRDTCDVATPHFIMKCSFLMVRTYHKETLRYLPPATYDVAALREFTRLMHTPSPDL